MVARRGCMRVVGELFSPFKVYKPIDANNGLPLLTLFLCIVSFFQGLLCKFGRELGHALYPLRMCTDSYNQPINPYSRTN